MAVPDLRGAKHEGQLRLCHDYDGFRATDVIQHDGYATVWLLIVAVLFGVLRWFRRRGWLR